MAGLSVDGDTLVVDLSILDKYELRRRAWRIPLASLRSVSVDAQAWQTVAAMRRPDDKSDVSNMEWQPGPPDQPHAVLADLPSRKDFRGIQLLAGNVISVRPLFGGPEKVMGKFGQRGSKIYASVLDGQPAVRVDLTDDAEVSGLLIAVPDAESTAMNIRSALCDETRFDPSGRVRSPTRRATALPIGPGVEIGVVLRGRRLALDSKTGPGLTRYRSGPRWCP